MGQTAVRKPEIMSPAGYWPQLHAAIEAGADAVYFGLKHFSARAKVGFLQSELPEIMRTLHRRGVRGYVTFNTLVFEHELPQAASAITAIAEAGVDALIIQDLGILNLARRIAPDLELHASTQMSITDEAGVRFAMQAGVQRVTLARELSIPEIGKIAGSTGCDLEVFVHGALCVAYSGQCFSSEAWGGRSANRGQCAQACRLPYDMIVDGVQRPLADVRYLLSPGDLFALEQVPDLARAGVAALKIEGRYKESEYVALVTNAYRQAVDACAQGEMKPVTPETRLQLEQVYSRGLGPHFLTGTNHQAVVSGRAPRHRGVLMGKVVSLTGESVTVETSEAAAISPLKPGDGVVFDAADWRSPGEPEEGGRLYQVVSSRTGTLQLSFGNGAIQFDRIRAGDLIWRTDDPDSERLARPFTAAIGPVYRRPVSVHVVAHEGSPLELIWQLPQTTVKVASANPLETATNQPPSASRIREQLARLGSTPYELHDCTVDLLGYPFIPSSLLNSLRREAVEALQAAQGTPITRELSDPAQTLASLREKQQVAQAPSAKPQLHLLVRTPEQLEAALHLAPDSITLDYLDLYGLRPSIESVKRAGISARVASPRVLKPGESRITNFLLSLDCEILVRASGILHALSDQAHARLIGDFSLNAANTVTAQQLFLLGIDRLTPTHDLNAAQIADLAIATGADRFEAIAYQHLPVFHTEHCVFCRFLSNGTSYLDCGRPCEKHQVALRDHTGRSHPVLADVGCRNTVFGAEAQEASAHLDLWLEAGIRHFRLEFVHENAMQVEQVSLAFQETLNGMQSPQALSRKLRKLAPQSTTEGSLFVAKDYLQLPILQ